VAENYRVTKQQRVSVMSLEGIPSMGYRIYFQVNETKWVDFVEVTEDNFDEETIASLIEVKVEKHLAVAQL
jgi:hypothetical protein